MPLRLLSGAVDYLLKPVAEARLREAVERARKLIEPLDVANEVAYCFCSRASKRQSKDCGPTWRRVFSLGCRRDSAFQADGELVWIVTAKQRLLRLRPSVSSKSVSRNRNSKSTSQCIVNVNHVRKMSALSSQRWLITLSNSLQLIASKRQAHNIRGILHW